MYHRVWGGRDGAGGAGALRGVWAVPCPRRRAGGPRIGRGGWACADVVPSPGPTRRGLILHDLATSNSESFAPLGRCAAAAAAPQPTAVLPTTTVENPGFTAWSRKQSLRRMAEGGGGGPCPAGCHLCRRAVLRQALHVARAGGAELTYSARGSGSGSACQNNSCVKQQSFLHSIAEWARLPKRP